MSSAPSAPARRYAVVGTGSRAGMYVRSMLTAHADVAAPVAWCDTNEVRMDVYDALLAEHGLAPLPRYAPDAFTTLLDEQHPDAVVVTSPDSTHTRYVVEALDRGVDVVCEKPMTIDVEGLQAITEAVRRSTAELLVTFNYRYSPRNSEVRRLLAEGAVGHVTSVTFEWLLDTVHGADYFRRWHRDKSLSGGLGVHKSTHHMDLVNWWVDDVPETVSALGSLAFYGDERAAERGLGDRPARGRDGADDDPFALDMAADDTLRRLYLEAEGSDGYVRDQDVFAPGVSIEDNLAVLVGYRGGPVLTYSLNAHSPWEGYRVAINGTRGRLELDVVERTHVHPGSAGKMLGPDGKKAPVVDPSVTHVDGVDGVGGARTFGSRLVLQRHWEQAEELAVPEGAGAHGGGDAMLLDDVFRGPGEDPLRRQARSVDGVRSVIVGIAANESLRTGQTVRLTDLGVALDEDGADGADGARIAAARSVAVGGGVVTTTPHAGLAAERLDLADVLLVLREGDHVAVTTRDLRPGTVLHGGAAGGPASLEVLDSVPRGHKVALVDIAEGAQVRKYGQSIGVATRPVSAGQHVHAHNLGMDLAEREHELATVHHELPGPTGPRPTFEGYRRAGGRVGTRNYIGILTSVNCSASTAKMIADQFRGSVLDEHEHVDGVMALTHDSGCGLVPVSEGAQMLVRTLKGYAEHPNFAGILVVGLGCEMIAVGSLLDSLDLSPDTLVQHLTIQESGGIRATVRQGVAAVRAMLPDVDSRRRETCDVSELVVGLNCGGSDGYSGITANPALGIASDLLVSYGATTVLAETPEVFGAEHLLTRRAVSEDVARRLLDRIAWWQDYAAAGGGSLDNNPSPGNKAGGLTTILEKSLGAVAKGGQADLVEVYRYAERITAKGFCFMDTPGYDPVSVTGLIAGGSTVVCFTTGRGSVLGAKPTPSLKLATNSELYARQAEDIDINCGRIVDGTATLDEVGREIFDEILAVASGKETVSEDLDLGQDEFIPWQLGTVT